MFKNYLKTAWRNITRNKVSSLINIIGLGMGMMVALLIGIWIYGEFSYNKNFKNYNSITMMMQNQTVDGNIFTISYQPYPLADALRNEFGSDFKYIVNATFTNNHILSFNEKNISVSGNFMSAQADSMLSLKLLKGELGKLNNISSIMISESTAISIFGTIDVIGKRLEIDKKVPVDVTAVYKDIDENSSFHDLKFIAPWDIFVNDQPWVQNAKKEQEWDNNSFLVYTQLYLNQSYQDISKKIADIKYRHSDKTFKPEMFLLPMKDWYLRDNFENGTQKDGRIQYVWMFGLVGGFVLLLACINFMNLSTARSEKRAKEVGIRKTLGSDKKQLVRLFYMESLLSVLLASIITIVFTLVLLPFFSKLIGKTVILPYGNLYFWISFIVFIAFTTLVSGSYPAWFLSSFKPVKVLKGTYRLGKSATLPRKVLVVLQLSVSTFLIIGTIVVYLQIQHVKNRPIGYNQSGLITFNMTTPEFYGKYDLLRNELLKSRAVLEMAESSSPLTSVNSNSSGFFWEGKGSSKNSDFAINWVSHDYGNLIHWKMLEGRDFSKQFPSDTSSVIINQAAADYIGFKEPIGKVIRWGSDAPPLKIIGVIDNILATSPYAKSRHALYFLNYENVNFITMKLNPTQGVQHSLKTIETIFKKYIPNAPFDYSFVDKDYAQKFVDEERIGNLALCFSLFAIFLNALGLIGLTGFVAEQKTKEIGIRKVLGASISNLWLMLSKEFIVLVGIACLVAIPLSYGYMHRWLSKYDYRTSIPWWLFFACSIITILITILSVSFYGIRAARSNPVKSLRSE